MLSEQQRTAYRDQLKERFQTLRGEVSRKLIDADNERFIDLAGAVHDVEEASVADLLADLQHADVGRWINEIRDIDAALLRIADGSFGICTDCEEEIDPRRLQSYPTAKRCQRCQTLHEKTYMTGKHPSI